MRRHSPASMSRAPHFVLSWKATRCPARRFRLVGLVVGSRPPLRAPRRSTNQRLLISHSYVRRHQGHHRIRTPRLCVARLRGSFVEVLSMLNLSRRNPIIDQREVNFEHSTDRYSSTINEPHLPPPYRSLRSTVPEPRLPTASSSMCRWAQNASTVGSSTMSLMIVPSTASGTTAKKRSITSRGRGATRYVA